MAAYALGAHELWLAGVMIEDNGLVAAIAARHLAASAADALLLVELGVADGVAVQVVGMEELRQLFAHELAEVGDAALGHVSL